MNTALRWFSCFLLSIVLSVPLLAQIPVRRHRADRELLLSYDNDFIFKTDRYYTSGVNISYSRLVDSRSSFYRFFKVRISDSLKLITQFHYGHKIFTPTGIRQRDLANFDRPYAGWHYLRFVLKKFSAANTMNTFQVEAGLIGEASGIGNFQKWWHARIGISQPKGWKYQIRNELAINIAYSKMRSWRLVKWADLVTDSGIKVGNGENKLSQDVTLRLGKFNQLSNSGYSGSRVISVTSENYDQDKVEAFLFYGVSGDHVVTNIFIQGSLFRDNSFHTEQVEKYVITRRWGFMLTNYYTTFYFTVYRLSPEVIGGKPHRYINANLALRF